MSVEEHPSINSYFGKAFPESSCRYLKNELDKNFSSGFRKYQTLTSQKIKKKTHKRQQSTQSL